MVVSLDMIATNLHNFCCTDVDAGAPLQFESQKNAVNLPQQGTGSLSSNQPAGPVANNALNQFPNAQPLGSVNSIGQNNNVPLQEQNVGGAPAVDTLAQSQNSVPNNADVQINPALNAPDQSADKLKTLDQNANPVGQDATGANGGQQLDAATTMRPTIAPQGDSGNAGTNENVQGERPQENAEFRMEAQQGDRAIVDPKPDSAQANDAIPLNSNGDSAAVLRPPESANLAPQGVQQGEGPQGYDQVKPPQSQGVDKIEVEQQKDVEPRGDYAEDKDRDQV